MEITIKTLQTAPATVRIETAPGAQVEIISTGKVIAAGTGPVCELEVKKCILWSDATPKLYTCRVTAGTQVIEKKFGVCQMTWQGKTLMVNAKEAQLRPICYTPAADALEEEIWRRVLALKDGYFNGVYCSGQTVPAALKEACDYYGVYLLTEEGCADAAYPSMVSCGLAAQKLDAVEAAGMDAMGNLLPVCAHATARWAMEREIRFGVCPVGGSGLAESWAWAGCEGRKMDVEVYVLAPSVELRLNGKSLGKKKTTDCKAVYKVNYAPGKLEAVAFNGSGTKIASGCLESAAGEVKLCLRPEAGAKPGQVVFIPVTLEGENGIVECGADRVLTVSVSGGALVKLVSAAAADHFDADQCRTQFGRALAVVRTGGNTVLTVSDGNQSVTAAL